MRRTRLHKQIRRQLLEKKQEFFVICPPGFEKECEKEIQTLFPDTGPMKAEKGGILLQAPLSFAPEANRRLRTASRILMRMARFTATDFKGFQKNLAEIPWQLYFPEGPLPEIRVLCHKCRLYHSDALAQRIRDFLSSKKDRESGAPCIQEKPLPGLYLRGEKDRFTLSVDSSGPLLYLRGLKTAGSRAPIRENLAAAILMASGYTPEIPLADPMCGSGTFSMEAALMASNLAPGSFRSFAWENWPAFLVAPFAREEEPTQHLLPAPIHASDVEEKVLTDFRALCLQHSFLENIQIQKADFFSLDAPRGEAGLIMLNPPYGLRMGTKKAAGILNRRLADHLQKKWQGWRTGILVPGEQKIPQEFSRLTCRRFQHGGLAMQLFTGKTEDMHLHTP
ncbi:putative N6-adenine-specific DNA methylase [Desulfobotulus alkaliphilus]|uniref:Putative N6-adenine-specific DNA methylase n=1 Tax=Desulfobotulus alkaliphilus TaxID=622671 RepID=A0A562S8U2_9BACT|nr:hypothetical protein [Desulfobotulus alkaliphilus]TWI76856.1 putative N6-adenine-specific DNA methylase [Desulfobotulus alkaliphilus]